MVYRQNLNTIPLAARSFANIAYLAPDTEPVEPSGPTKARITAVSTGGSSGTKQVFGGAQAEIVTGRKTTFERMVVVGRSVRGLIVTTDDCKGVRSGRVIIRMSDRTSKADDVNYQTASVQTEISQSNSSTMLAWSRRTLLKWGGLLENGHAEDLQDFVEA